MSDPVHSDQTHSHHWRGEHNVHLIKVNNDMAHLSAKAMNIIWGNDQRFWNWISLPKEESCFEAGAELIQVNWFEVIGSLDLAGFSPLLTYEIIYVFKFKVDSFGWNSSPVAFELITPDGKKSMRSEILEPYRNMDNNQWHEVHGGEFYLPSEMTGKLKFRMCEVQTNWWKGGMILEGVKVRPKLVKSIP